MVVSTKGQMRRFFPKSALTIFALLATPGAGRATEWLSVLDGRDAHRFIDADAIVLDGPMRTFWLRNDFRIANSKGMVRSVEKWIHDCEHGRAKMIALTWYDAKGRVIGSSELPRYELSWIGVTPDSIVGHIHSKVCALQ